MEAERDKGPARILIQIFLIMCSWLTKGGLERIFRHKHTQSDFRSQNCIQLEALDVALQVLAWLMVHIILNKSDLWEYLSVCLAPRMPFAVDGMAAFMQGKLKLAGDLNLAMKLTQMFKIRESVNQELGVRKETLS